MLSGDVSRMSRTQEGSPPPSWTCTCTVRPETLAQEVTGGASGSLLPVSSKRCQHSRVVDSSLGKEGGDTLEAFLVCLKFSAMAINAKPMRMAGMGRLDVEEETWEVQARLDLQWSVCICTFHAGGRGMCVSSLLARVLVSALPHEGPLHDFQGACSDSQGFLIRGVR